jgi:hypothetical protein
MVKLRIVGDIHGKFDAFCHLTLKDVRVFQLGDFGLGFGPAPKDFGDNVKFIRGNHDSPQECQAHKNYAGEFGYWPEFKLFFMGGAFSIDHAWRRSAMKQLHYPLIWWPDEELSVEQLEEAKKLYLEYKPEVVVTHDCPSLVSRILLGELLIGFRPEKLVRTRTGDVLQSMFALHQPKQWFFGHYHVDKTFTVEGTEFVCLNELSTYDLVVTHGAA